jgi:hypothetical protein
VGRGQALAAVAIALALSGCGGGAALKPSGCVHVFFYGRDEGRTTRAEIRAVRDRLESFRDKLVSYRFVSKRQALALMRRRHPELVRRMPYNPFPDAFEATPGSVAYAHDLVDELTPPPRGVHAVKYSRTRRRC